MKKILQYTVSLGFLILALTACIPVIGAIFVPTKPPASTPQQTHTQAGVRMAQVESVEIQIMPTDPIQVNAIVRGSLTEACAKLGSTQLSYESNTFLIALLTTSPTDQGCAQVITPFEQTIPLDTTGLPPGEYTVKANGVSAVFSLPAEGTSTVTPVTSGEQDQTKTFTSTLYGYKVSYPANWTILINTSVPSGPGTNPEYVTLTTNDASNLPRIEIEVLTGEPPMQGYENCEKNFVFRSLPACKISLPAGQNPATEIWIFQNGSAYFFIAMQYQDTQAVQLFDDFLSSFMFTQ